MLLFLVLILQNVSEFIFRRGFVFGDGFDLGVSVIGIGQIGW